MKKNGFTIIELLTSFVLTMIIMVFLFEVVIELKDVYVQSDVRTKVTNSNALVATSINNKLDKIPIFSVECNDENTSCDINSGSSDSLTIGQAGNSIQIGNKKIQMPKGDSIVEDTFKITYNLGSSSKNKHDSYIKIAYQVKGENIDKELDFSYIYTFDMIDRKTGYVYLKPGFHVKNISSGYVSCDDGVLSCNVPIPSVKADDGYTYSFFSSEELLGDDEIWSYKNNYYTGMNSISINGQGATYYFYAIDETAPTVSFDYGGNGEYVKNVNNIKINVKDSGSGLKSNQKLYYAWSTNDKGTNLTDSDYKSIDLKYEDDYQASASVDAAAGMNANLHLCVKGGIEDKWPNLPNSLYSNKSKITCTDTFKFDNAGPIISFDKNSDTNYSSEKTVKVNVTDNEAGLSDNVSLYYGWSTSDSEEPDDYFKINKQSKGTKQVSFGASIKDVSGKYYLWIKPIMVADSLGNESKNIVKTGPFYLDNKAPDVEISSTGSSFTSSVKVKISDDVSGLDSGNKIKYAWSSNADLLEDNNKSEYDKLSWKSASFSNAKGDLSSEVSLDVSNLNGKYYLYVYGSDVMDVAGNKNTKVVVSNGSYLFDGNAPNISIGKSGCYEYENSEDEDPACSVYEEDTWTTSKEIEIDVTDNFDDAAGSGIENGGVIKYGWSTSNKIEPEEYSYHTIDDDDIDSTYSFSISADGLTGEYYLWVVSESVADLAGNVSDQVVVSSKPYQFDNNPPEVDANYSSTTNSITVVVNANDLESGVENYKYKIGELENENSLKCVKWKNDVVSSSDEDCEQFANDWLDGENNVYTFKDLKADTSYPIKIKVTDAAGNSKVLFKEFKTSTLESPRFSDTGSSVIITYPDGCGSTLECKYTVDGKTTTVTEDEVEIAYPDSGFIIASVSDGINEASRSYTITGDPSAPTIHFTPDGKDEYVKNTGVTVNINDGESGLKENQNVYYAWSKSNSVEPEFSDINLNLSESYNWDILNKGGENEYDVSGFKIDGDKLMMYYDYWCESSANEALYQTGSFEFTGSKFSFDYTLGVYDDGSAMYYRIYQGDTLKFSSEAYSSVSTGNTSGTISKTLDQGTYRVQIYFVSSNSSTTVCEDSWISNIKIDDRVQSLGMNSGMLTTSNSSGANNASVTVPSSASEGLTGTYYLWIKSGISDVSDNISESVVSKAFYFDNIPPKCVTSGGTDKWIASAQTITGTCSDSDSGCSSNAVSRTFSIDTSQSGNYNANYSPGKVTDNAGNSTTCPTTKVKVTGITLNDYQSGAVFMFDGQTGLSSTTWKDQSGNNRDGTIVGATVGEYVNNVNHPYSVYFDGVDDYVRIAQLNYPAVTLESSFKFKTLPGSGVHIISNLETGGYALYKSSVDNKMGATAYKDGAYRLAYTSAPSIGTTYYGATRVNNEYIKSTLNETTTTTNYSAAITSPKNSTYIVLGGNPNGSTASTDLFNGYMYTARMYSSVLSDDQLQKHYVIDKARFGRFWN